jgi:hypothetical protein
MGKQGLMERVGEAGGKGGYEKTKEEREKLAAKNVKAAAEYDYSEEERRKRIDEGLKMTGSRGNALRASNSALLVTNRGLANAKAQVNALETQRRTASPWAVAGIDARIKTNKDRIKTLEAQSAKADSDWKKAQNKHLFGHEDIGNFSQAVAHRATAKDWMGHIGGAAAIGAGAYFGGIPLAAAGLALGGARGLMTLKRYVYNKGGSGRGGRGMSDAVTDSNYASAAAKAAAKLKPESEFKALQKLMREGKPMTPEQRQRFEDLRRAGAGGGGGGGGAAPAPAAPSGGGTP